jgi:hypothetical protein
MRARVLVLDFVFVIPAKAGIQGSWLLSPVVAVSRSFVGLGGRRLTSLCVAKEK